jgi:GGDEF domain-containing protein
MAANAALQRNLREIDALQEQLREQAIRDPLTGLYNRRYLDATLERELARSQRDGQPLALILMDLDHFKRVNDTYGHQAGDEVLLQLAKLLTAWPASGRGQPPWRRGSCC